MVKFVQELSDEQLSKMSEKGRAAYHKKKAASDRKKFMMVSAASWRGVLQRGGEVQPMA